MGKKVKEYKAGDFIFAKVKGYPAWPARIQKPNGKKYFVYFYGTGETANLPPNQIFDYADNKDKFLTKTIKRKDFNDGARQIEHDFANKVPLEDIIGVPVQVAEEPMDTSANDTANDSTADDSALDTTADDTTAADTTAANDTNATQNDTTVEDSDEGALVIDEGKKGRKPTAKPAPTPKAAKEPKTPRGKPKREEPSAKEKEDAPEGDGDKEKKEEEIVSRSGRKIRPKRYIDEQTEENATLPSPAAKKRRGASPAPEKEKPEKTKNADSTPAEKTSKLYNAVPQAELEDLKEPFQPEHTEKEHILIAYLPSGQYVGIKLFQNRPVTFKNEAAKLHWDRQSAAHSVTLKLQLEKGHITAQSVITQLEMELNLTDEEKANLDKEREIEEKKSRVQFLKAEMKLIELDARIKSCLSLEKADTDLCLKLLDELIELETVGLMLLKHPHCLETIKRMRAYVGNTPSWELSEEDCTAFGRQASLIRKRADQAYKKLKGLFTPPENLSFWEYFSERVIIFKKCTAHLTSDERLEMVHEPLEMTLPTSHTMKTAIDSANEEVPPELDDSPPKKLKATPAKSKKATAASTPKPAPKRQSSRSKQTEANNKEDSKQNNKEDSKPEEAAKDKPEEVEKPTEDKPEDPEPEKAQTEDKPEEPTKDTPETAKNTTETAKDTAEAANDTTETTKDTAEPAQEKQDDKSTQNDEKEQSKKEAEKNGDDQNDKEDEAVVEKVTEKAKADAEDGEKVEKTEKEGDKKKAAEKVEKEKDDVVEPRAKRGRESNRKTEPPPTRSPAKRKSRS